MQFEEFDNKIKEAAEHHHPAYDEQAWVKMEKLLNKHLPQKDDRRRRFIFFLLFLAGLGLTGLLITKPWKTEKPVANTTPAIPAGPTAAKQPADHQNDIPQAKTVSTDGGEKKESSEIAFTPLLENAKPVSPIAEPVVKTDHVRERSLQTGKPANYQPLQTVDQHKQTGVTAIKEEQTLFTNANTNKEPVTLNTKQKEPVTAIEEKIAEANSNNKEQTVTPQTGLTVSSAEQTKSNPEKENPLVVEQANKKEKNKKKRSNSFFFSFSTGPDVSFAEKNSLGTTKLLLGGGLGYTFNNRFTIRAGFYTARKIYTASPEAYHAPAVFYTYYPYLEKVDADCKVYEIPVSLSYRFGHSSRQSWFAGAGISSYLMKKEVYDYYYKRIPAGPTYQRKWTINNENEHFLAGLTLSGGYQRKINKYLSVMVEPYVKLPLSGVGYGKVKLYSGGVLLSVGINPFAAKKRPR